MSSQFLAPPRPGYVNPDHIVPLSPPARPPFAHYHSATSTIPSTPNTPYPPPPNPSKPPLTTYSSLPPYLTLPPRLLLTTLTPCVLPFILTIAHLIQTRNSTSTLAASLKSSLLSACNGLATGAASLQTLPRYLAMQTNDEMVRATQASILAVGAGLMDCVTIVETVVGFIVDTYRSMLLCTIELAVRGTLEILIGAVELISDGVTSSLNSIRTGIQNDIADGNSLIQDAVAKVNSITSKVDITITIPQFTVPSLSSLQNVTIPTTFESTLITLNNTLPTLAELKAKMDAILDVPFEELKTLINATRLDIAASFNSSILPIPPLSTLAKDNANTLQTSLCGDLDTSLIDDTANALHKLSNVAIGLMFFLLIAIWAVLCFWEWKKWSALRDTVVVVEEECAREGRVDGWRMVAIVEHPMLEKYGSRVLERIAPAPRTRTNLRWFCAYLAHPTLLALLFISLLGFLTLQFQLLALNAIKHHAEANANSTVAASTNDLTAKLNGMAANSSASYAIDFNNQVVAFQKRVDEEMFGEWLNTTAVTLNQTLVTFYAEVESALNTTFGGTILYNPINNFLYCILGSKITNLEKGLTWISNHAQLTLPTLPADILLLSNTSMNELVSPITSAAVGTGTGSGEDQGVVGTLIAHFESALIVERNFYVILLGVWLGLVVIGLFIVLWHPGGRDRYIDLRRKRGWGDGGSAGGSDNGGNGFWSMTKPVHPIYYQHTDEKEAQFRGTAPSTPSSIPRIIEPPSNKPNLKTNNSFFDTRDLSDSTPRPFIPRKSTFGATLSTLAAPGQAFLRLTNRSTSSIADDGHSRGLVRPGTSSERYNSGYNQYPRDEVVREMEVETPPPFWVTKFYKAMDGAKGLILPTKGQRHGAALQRGGSTRSDKSFGASQIPSATLIKGDWGNGNGNGAGKDANPGWTMVDPGTYGRSIDDYDRQNDSRYPRGGVANTTQNVIYPRPMSRAPTLRTGDRLPHINRDPFTDDPPIVPSKHDSIDYLEDGEEDGDERGETRRDVWSPGASDGESFFGGEVEVGSVSKVKTGTAALAAVLANIDRGRGNYGDRYSEGRYDDEREGEASPFESPFEREEPVRRTGGRI